MSSFTEQQIAFLRRWNWENMDSPGEAFAIAASHGFSFANMAILAAHAAVERKVGSPYAEETPPPLVPWPWGDKTFAEVNKPLGPFPRPD